MFSEFLIKFRKSRGWKQSYIAYKIGISQTTYHNYETGKKTKIPISFIKKIRDTFMDILTEEELKVLNTNLNSIEKVKHEENEPFSEFLVKFRESRGWTQKDIADKMGIFQANCSNYETGKKTTISFIKNFQDTFIDTLTEEELKVLNTNLNSIEKVKYEENVPFSEFLVKFRKNHGLTKNEIADKIGISVSTCSHYEFGKHKLRNARFIRRFRDTFVDMLTEEELKMIDNYISLTETHRNCCVNNIDINLGLIVESVRERNHISLRKMGEQLGLSRTYINNAELGIWGFSDNNLLNFYTHYQELLTTEEKGQIYDYLINNYPEMIHGAVKNLIIDNHLLSTLIASMKLQKEVTTEATYRKK